MKSEVKGYFDRHTGASNMWSLILQPNAAPSSIRSSTSTRSLALPELRTPDMILSYVDAKGLNVQWVLDTHPHADHLSAAHYLQRRTGALTAIGERLFAMQRFWKGIYNWKSLAVDGSQWDRLFTHGETFEVGSIPARVLRRLREAAIRRTLFVAADGV
jgi:glyoxylase-like metal-dependent hydrolase (beta-lactamase superfamily II)